MQRTAIYRDTLQHTVTHCNTLQHTATHCDTLRHTATHCNTLQHTLQHTDHMRSFGEDVIQTRVAPSRSRVCMLFAIKCCSVWHRVVVFYSVLQCVAVCCSVLQCVAVCCSVLQCDAACCGVRVAHGVDKVCLALSREHRVTVCCSMLHVAVCAVHCEGKVRPVLSHE